MALTPNSSQVVVLVIDIDRTRVSDLTHLFQENDYRVYTAGTVEEARQYVETQRIDVVLLAVRRPDYDIKGFMAVFKEKIIGFKIPVIVILENFVEENAVSALKAGAADFLTFPVDFQELLKRIRVRLQLIDPGTNHVKKGFLSRLLYRLADGFHSGTGTEGFMGGRYEKLGRLGIGSFGEVWKVRDIVSDPPKTYVAKIPLSKKLNGKIENEAKILRRLSGHVGIPDIREVIEQKSKKILIQEFVFGKTLYAVIERELGKKAVESIVVQLVNVVAYAHSLKIIHRDIKPGNVMVRPDGTIKLLDFGVARELKGKAFSDTITGSRPYMSPEQIMGKSQRSSDVWALGVVMYVLYTGMFPFYHEVEKVLMDMILELPPSPPSKFDENLDPGIERIIMNCLEKKPENRYPDAGALKKDIMDSFPHYGEIIMPVY